MRTACRARTRSGTITPLTPNTADLISTLRALPPRGGPVQDPVLALASFSLDEPAFRQLFKEAVKLDVRLTLVSLTNPCLGFHLAASSLPRMSTFQDTLTGDLSDASRVRGS